MLELHKSRGFAACLVVFVCVGVWLSFFSTTQVNAQGEGIRVALFVDKGVDGGYRNTVPIVSIGSDTGMELYGPSGAFDNIGEAHYLRFSLDQYYLIAGETKKASEARQISQLLAQQGFANVILEYNQSNEQVYRVITGSGANLQAISKVQQDVKAKTNRDARVAGPFRVNAGSFVTMQEATQRLTQIQSNGYTAHVAQVRNENGLSYQVWVGDEVSAQAQAALQENLATAFPNLSFQPANAQEYIIYAKTSMSNSQEVPFYFITPHQKVTVVPSPSGITPVLKVEERENRSYRGKMELSRYMDKLTVVNTLPLEHYLYSVVGTEMAPGWPIEALKAQAVMSRNFAYLHLQQNKYGVAHLSDTVFEQAYYGFGREADDVRQAVEATQGEYLTYKGSIFSTFYFSNAGGMTADGLEVWGNPLETHQPVQSNDRYPETVQATWYRVQDEQGKIGYVIDQYINKLNEKSASGFPIGTVNTSSLNYRSGPSTEHALIGSLNQGDRVIIFDEAKQNNAYSWIAGPFTGHDVSQMINKRAATAGTSPVLSQAVRSLKVTERGPSGRVLSMEGNGQTIHYGSPDGHRSIFNDGNSSLRSTKFEVEAMGEFAILGASGQLVEYPTPQGQKANVSVLSAGSSRGIEVNGYQDQFAVLNQQGNIRITTKEPSFRLHGQGYGHGLGASQWGSRAMALEGYNYRQILQHYFHNNSVVERK